MKRSRPGGAPVRFGTSGWRAVLGDGFDFERAGWVAAALAGWAAESEPAPRIVVAFDTRFAADRVAAHVVRVLAGAGARPLWQARPLPTPVASRAVRRRRAQAGLLVTASHNPPEYLGLKVVAPWGGSAPREITDALEARVARLARRGAPPQAAPGPPSDLLAGYVEAVSRLLDTRALARAGLTVHYDALHGTGAEVLPALLEAVGVDVVLYRGEPDPCFGGGAPDPSPERLTGLARRLRDERARRGRRIGLASDGDADRFALLDGAGRWVSETDALALLVDHLARRGRIQRGVAISVATGSLVERVAASHGLAVSRHAIGFKHLTPELLARRADVAGEESGGFAWAPFARDKDGLLAGALLAELAAEVDPGERLSELRRRHGRRHCGRRAWPLGPRDVAGLAALGRTPPARLGGARVEGASRHDGLRLALPDGFVLWRVSGTEPLLRIYAEAATARALEARLVAARRLLQRSAG